MMRWDLIFHDSVTLISVDNIDNWNNYGQLTVWHLTNPGNWASIWSAKCVFSDRKKMRFMQTESVLQTKNRSGPAKNRFSVALLQTTVRHHSASHRSWYQTVTFNPHLTTIRILINLHWKNQISSIFYLELALINTPYCQKGADIIWALSWENLSSGFSTR